MRFNIKNKISKFIIVSFIVIILFNLIMPTCVKAEQLERHGWGGVLYDPIQTFIVFLGDSVLRILESFLLEDGYPEFIREVDPRTSTDWETFSGYWSDGAAIAQDIPLLGSIVKFLFGESVAYIDVPNIQISPGYIFANRIAAFDINFFNPKESETSPAYKLQPIVSYWYNVFRGIAIVGLLLVIVYIGIRIVISTTASEKSRYKQMITDWIVALCLVFTMHYIMSFIVTMSGTIAEKLDGFQQGVNEAHYAEFTTSTAFNSGSFNGTFFIKYEGDPILGMVRINLQSGRLTRNFSYTMLYLVLVIYTLIFVFIYLKRVIHMAFFTIIAPLVALTYPLDKLKDKRAQAFEFWFKGYIFNALIQPVHLLLYYIVVGSALELATKNPIYAIVAIGFLIPAEKILRKFFGLDKADTSGVLEGMMGGAMVMSGVNMLKKGISGIGGGKDKKDGKEEGEKKSGIRTADSGNNTSHLMDEISGENNNNNRNNNDNNDENNGDENNNNSNDGEQNGNDNSQGGGTNNRRIHVDSEQSNENNENSENNEDNNSNIRQEENNNGSENGENNSTNNTTTENNNTNANNEQAKKDKEKKREVKRLMARKFAKNTGKFLGRNIIKAYGAATVGTIGVAAGLASDKYSNVATFGIAGAAAGNAMAKAGMKTAKKIPTAVNRVGEYRRQVRDQAEREVYTEKERKRIQNERADKEFLKDKDAREKYSKAFAGEDYKKIMEEAIEYRRYGVTDNDAIIKAMKLQVDGLSENKKDKRRILTAKVASQLGRKDIDAFGNRLRSNGFSDADAEIMKNAVRRYNDFE